MVDDVRGRKADTGGGMRITRAGGEEENFMPD